MRRVDSTPGNNRTGSLTARGFSTRLGRRQFVGGMAALAGSAAVGSTALAGCGMTAGGGGGGDGKQMTFLNDLALDGTPFGDAITAFEKESGIKVEIQPVPAEYDTKFRTVLASGAPPDLVKINDDYVKGISRTGGLLDLTPFIEKDKIDVSNFSEELYNFPQQSDGKFTAWVIAHSPRLMFYNVDMFKEAGLPLPPTEWTSDGWTWDDFVEVAKKLTIPGERFGTLIYLDTGFEQTWAVNNGEPDGIYSPDGRTFTLANPKAAEAIQWATDLTCVHKVQPAWGDLQSDDIDLQMFAQGRLAMMYRQFSSIPYIEEAVKDINWDVAPPPAGPAGQLTESSVVYSIPEKAKNPEAAWELLKFLTTKEGGEILVKGKMWLPMHKDALSALSGPPENVGLFAEAVDHSTLPNQSTDTLGAREIYRPALDKVYNCEKTASEVLSSVKAQVEEIISK
ncbi:MAG: ABC transporter substrate-binding protein [Actinopolymorphaceae bacterium]